MKKIVLACCIAVLPGWPAAAAAQVPRDTPPPIIESARRERELRALIASGAATKETYLELAGLESRQNRYPDALEALRGAAALEPDSAEGQHRVATYCWEFAQKGTDLDAATRLKYIRDGIAAEDRALALKPDYREAMTYKNILLRMQANQTGDPGERARLIAEADALRDRVMEMQRLENSQSPTPGTSDPGAPPFQGFPEPYEESVARLTPVRVGGGITVPTKTQDVKPAYPADAQAAHVQGVVIIEAIVDPSGSIANARVLRSIPMLDEAALGAVSRWHFVPTQVNGTPASVVMTVTVNFTLQQ